MTDRLKFKNKKFRIMLVGDPHEKEWTEDSQSLNKIKDYLDLQYTAVQTLKPDLIILMGDNASASTPEYLREILLRITAPFFKAGIPFSFILGNHDLETKLSDLDTQYSVYKSLPGIIFPENYNKYGDYFLPVKASDSDENAVILWHFYSGTHPDLKYHSHYSAVNTEQIQWYEKTAASLKKGRKPIPAIAFEHVPVAEEFELLDQKTSLSLIFNGTQGLDGHFGKYYDLKKNVAGYMGEAPCVADYNCGQFASWKRTGDVFAAFFGHDHMNDLIGSYNGIILGQCKTSSFRVYGDGLMQGVRIIDLDETKPFRLKTKMVYYRDLIGTDCRSVHGREKILRDRTSVKLDYIQKTGRFILPAAAIGTAITAAKAKRKTK